MTLFQIFVGLLITLSMAVRPIVYKKCVEYFPASLSSTFTSIWLLLALFITFPFLGHLFTDNAQEIVTSPYLLLSVAKGFLLYFLIKLQQVINKEGSSSSVFFGFIAMALGSLVINIFFKEGLGIIKLLCVCLMGVLGVFFVLKGDARRLSTKGKIYFVTIILIVSSFTITDHLAISQVGWYAHLLFSSIAMFLGCFFAGISKQDYRNIFRNKDIVIAGLVYSSSEFLIIYSSINVMPVSVIAVFLRMSAPLVMLVSVFKYKEQTVKNQLVFGVMALLLALPIILMKN